MAQELTFITGDKTYVCSPIKLERAKVYGSTEKIILDERDEICKAVSMDESGTIIIPKGGICLGIVDENLNWVERNELRVVNHQGEEIQQIPSTFSTPVELCQKADIESFLDYSITTVYQLTGDYQELINFLGDDLYEFTFNYRNSYESNPAFLTTNGTELFMLIGVKNNFEFITLQETAVIDTEEAESEEDEFDIDFSMM